MKFRSFVLALVALAMTWSPALAANNYDVIDAHGATRTMAARDSGGVLHGQHLIEGLFGGVPTPANMTASGVIDFNCVSGCSGGGGGGGSVTAGTNAFGDGYSVTMGQLGDPVWSGSGSGTQQAIAKYTAQKVEAVRAALVTGIPVTGSISLTGATVGTGGSTTYVKVANYDPTTGLALDPNGPLPAGAATIGGVNVRAAATGGCNPFGLNAAATTNATNVNASAGTLCSLALTNTTGTAYYARLYNLATTPTCTSATGYKMSILIPANTSGAGIVVNTGPFGWDFPAGFGFCLTGGPTSTDNTPAAVGVGVLASTK